MAIDRRRAKRFVVVDLDLHDQAQELPVGKVVNISDGGLFALADMAYPVGDVRPFFIPVNSLEDEPEMLLFTAWVIWSHPNRLHSNKFSLGLEFIDAPNIEHLLERIAAT